MAAPRGTRPPNAGKGRPKGAVNKTTADVREAIAKIAQRNIEAVEAWLNEIDDPVKRLDLFLRMIEYHIPKLARTEMSGEGGKPIEVHIVDPTRRDNTAE